jgi:hypothetical protein
LNLVDGIFKLVDAILKLVHLIKKRKDGFNEIL